jgi:hypothetical protein
MFILFEKIEKGRPDLADAVHFVTPAVSILIVGEPAAVPVTQKGNGAPATSQSAPSLRLGAQAPALLSLGNEVSLKAFSVRVEKSTSA